tara:strand:- start:1866 stop:3131 length:1266 start_codon:yes stop_codon:yes gene_type:complete
LSDTPPELEKAKLSDAISALKIRDFRRFWFAGLISNSGGWLQGLASPFIMYEMTESGTWVGTSVFALMIPMALVGPFAGPMADRLSRRHILLVCEIFLGVIAISNAVFWWSGVREPLVYVGINIIYGFANGYALPAWQAYVADLVPRDVLMNAITLNSTQFNAARAIGPSLGGVLLAVSGPGWAFLGNGISFFLVFFTLLSLPATAPSPLAGRKDSQLSQFTKGWAYAKTQKTIVTGYIAAGLVAMLGAPLIQVHIILFSEKVFEVGEFKFGLLMSTYGIGAVMIAPWLAAFGTRFKKSSLLVSSLTLYGCGELLLSSTEIYYVGLISIFVVGCAHLIMATTTNTTLQLFVPEPVRGRVMAMYLMVFTIGAPLGSIIQGPLADQFGTRWVVAVMGCLFIVAAFFFAVTKRAATFDFDEPLI